MIALCWWAIVFNIGFNIGFNGFNCFNNFAPYSPLTIAIMLAVDLVLFVTATILYRKRNEK